MNGRLVLAIISSIIEESLIVLIVLWALPQMDVNIPLPGLIAIMVAWSCISVFTFRKGSRALRRKPMLSLPDMVGNRGIVVNWLAPEGMVKIRGELWAARSEGGELEPGSRVIVVAQDRMRLSVRPGDSVADEEDMA